MVHRARISSFRDAIMRRTGGEFGNSLTPCSAIACGLERVSGRRTMEKTVATSTVDDEMCNLRSGRSEQRSRAILGVMVIGINTKLTGNRLAWGPGLSADR